MINTTVEMVENIEHQMFVYLCIPSNVNLVYTHV